jgi:hypothetical protein
MFMVISAGEKLSLGVVTIVVAAAATNGVIANSNTIINKHNP